MSRLQLVPLPKGAKKVRVNNMIDAGLFWVYNVEDPESDEIKNKLSRFINCSGYNKHSSSYIPEEGEIIAVCHKTDNSWVRGEIQTVFNTASGIIYDVFLIDYGCETKVRSCHIRKIPDNLQKLKRLAYKVGVYGVIPVTIDIDTEHGPTKQIVCDWPNSAREFVNMVINKYESAYFVEKCLSNDICYGDLFFERVEDSGYLNLGIELCENDYAVEDESTFKNDVLLQVERQRMREEMDLNAVKTIKDAISVNQFKFEQRKSPAKREEPIKSPLDDFFVKENFSTPNKAHPIGRGQNLLKFVKEKSPGTSHSLPSFQHKIESPYRSSNCESTSLQKPDLAINPQKQSSLLPLLNLLQSNTPGDHQNKIPGSAPNSTEELVRDLGTDDQASKFPMNVNRSVQSSRSNDYCDYNKKFYKPLDGKVEQPPRQEGTSSVSSDEITSVEKKSSPVNPQKQSSLLSLYNLLQKDISAKSIQEVTKEMNIDDGESFQTSCSIETSVSDKLQCTKRLVNTSKFLPAGADINHQNKKLPKKKQGNILNTIRPLSPPTETDSEKGTSLVHSQPSPINTKKMKSNILSTIHPLPPPMEIDQEDNVAKNDSNKQVGNIDTSESNVHISNSNTDPEQSSKVVNKQVKTSRNMSLFSDLLMTILPDCKNIPPCENTIPEVKTPESNPSKVHSSPIQNTPLSLNSNIFERISTQVSVSEERKSLTVLETFKQVSNEKSPTLNVRLPQCALEGLKKQASPGSISSSSAGNSPSQQSRNISSLSSNEEPDDVVVPPHQIDGLNFNPNGITRLIENLPTSRVLVHGEFKNGRPVSSLSEVLFHKDIHKALTRLGYSDLKRIQTYAWPIILKGHNLVMINPPKSGKTFGYVVPLMSFLLHDTMYADLQKGHGPVILIICSGCRSVQSVYRMCSELLSENKDYKIIATHGGGAEQENVISLINGCHVLISTPRCLLRLMKYSELVIKLNRLCHLVLDEADLLSFKYKKEVQEIMRECNLAQRKRGKQELSLQIIAVAEKWCPAIESLAKVIPRQPAICIGSYLEAALYAHLKPQLHFIEEKNRVEVVTGIMKENKGLYKTVIVCISQSEVEEIVPALRCSISQNILVAHESMLHYDVNEVFQKWQICNVPGNYPVLVCTDGILHLLNILDASWLIHYNLPKESKTDFGLRFSCLWKNYQDMFKPKDPNKLDCSVHILLKEDNSHQLPAIVQFMKRLGATISPKLISAAEAVLFKKEEMKRDAPLCYSIKAFGDCWDKNICKDRHIIFKDLDEPAGLPLTGKVKIKITHIRDACNFSARILEVINETGKVTTIKDKYLYINMRLSLYFRIKQNKTPPPSVKVGDICAVEAKSNLYHRAQILEITKYDSVKAPLRVHLKYIDIGETTFHRVSSLFALPNDLKDIEPQVVEIFLCNMVPCDADWTWSYVASLQVSKWIKEALNEDPNNKVMVGKIVLSLGRTLWLDPVECEHYLPTADVTTIILSLRRNLLAAGLAVENNNHISKLYNLCHKAGLQIPNFHSKPALMSKPVEPVAKHQWAFLSDDDEYHQVLFLSGFSPDQFFIQLCKWEDRLLSLKKDIQKYVDAKQFEKTFLKPGDFCIGKFPEDGMWYRAQILEKNEEKMELFFVDYGDKATIPEEEVIPINNTLIQRLPFQAIECSLYGLKPLSIESWHSDAIHDLYNLMFVSEEVKPVFLKVHSKHRHRATCTGGHLYKVTLVDTSTSVDVIINKRMIELGNVATDEKEMEIVEGVCVPKPELEKNLEEESDDERPKEPFNEPLKPAVQEVGGNESVVSLHHNGEVYDFDFNACDDGDLGDLLKDMVRESLCSELNIPDRLHKSLPQIMPAEENLSEVNKTSSHIESIGENLTSEGELSENNKDTLNSGKDDNLKPSENENNVGLTTSDLIPPLINKAKISSVTWRQNYSVIWIKIKIVGVETYYLFCDGSNLEFSTCVNGETYYIFIQLFGGVSPLCVDHAAHGQYVLIKLQKLLIGFLWPQLDVEKQSWIKVDFDSAEAPNSDETLQCFDEVGNLIAQMNDDRSWFPALGGNGESGIESILKETRHKIAHDVGEDSDDEDACSDIVEHEGDFDPFDPLN